jgi:hypothetical protein
MRLESVLRWAERRRPFDRLETRAVKMYLKAPEDDLRLVLDQLRYVLSFARLTWVRNSEGADVDLSGPLAAHSQIVRGAIEQPILRAKSLWEINGYLPDLVARTKRARESVLEHLPIDRESLEEEITTRLLVIASGGGGGAGYLYPGCYELLDRHGHMPELMVGTSIGGLMSMFRSRRRRFDPAPLFAAAKRLAWSKMFRVLESQNRYGLPATLRLYLHTALGDLFLSPETGEPLTLEQIEIPMYTVATGITVDALKHDLDYYEHLLDEEVAGKGFRGRVRTGMKAVSVIREFLGRRDALKEVVLGRDPGTEGFDVLDAAGFSAAIPGVIHYDVLREDNRMKRILDNLYSEYGITRLGEGGLVSNVPARVAWETVVSGRFGRRQPFVLALDCFAPNARKIAWFPVQQVVRTANVEADRAFMDEYVTFARTLSPMNLVPPVRDALLAIRWGREALEPFMPYIDLMMAPIPPLR